MREGVQGTLSVTTTISLPVSIATFPPPSMMPVRTSGPLVSSMMATGTPISSATLRTRSIMAFWLSWVPCEKLKRATFMPFSMSLRSVSSSSQAGPMVHTIFVFFWAIWICLSSCGCLPLS